MKQLFFCSSLLLIILLAWANDRGKPLANGLIANHIVIEKSAHRLLLFSNGTLLKNYTVSLGLHPQGKKEREGDGRTPEGIYQIDFKKQDSAFHLALHISYPNLLDIEKAKKGGYLPGGAIMIHGMKNGLGWLGKLHQFKDWTAGCIAVTDWEIEEIERTVQIGSTVEIKP